MDDLGPPAMCVLSGNVSHSYGKWMEMAFETIGKWWFNGVLWDLPSGNLTYSSYINIAMGYGKWP